LREPAPSRGLNAAIAIAARLAWQRGARSVLVIPADLPMLSSSSLNRLLAAAEPHVRAVLAPDSARRGTNALLVLRRTRLSWAFGEDSLREHGERLTALGWVWVLCSIPELAFDLDTAEDLARLRTLARFSRVARMV
jgi:2-phospho-L-lactate guanylyltransferase